MSNPLRTNRRDFLRLTGTAGLSAALGGLSCSAKSPMNVLFVSFDDMNNWVGCLGGHPDAKTPNIDRLANSGTLFTRAYSASTTCNSSRTALLTGLSPMTSGVYSNKSESLRVALPNAVTIPEYFRANGYQALGGGKIFHNAESQAWNNFFWPEVEDEFERRMEPDRFGFPYKNMFNWGPVAVPDAKTWDGRLARWAVRQLERQHDRPFFLGVGFFRPHLPWYAPRKYFRPFKPEHISLPEILEGDIKDVPLFARLRRFHSEHLRIVENHQFRPAVASYLASMYQVDTLLGKILDALESSPYAGNTLVVLWSDHGFHLGQKDHWGKYLLWEQTAQVPFIISVPGLTKPGSRCDRPVSLLHIYKTLNELCGLPELAAIEGRSLVPLLRDAEAPWEGPAICSLDPASHSLRTDRWRFIRYSDGSEELYDHEADPNEWTNLAGVEGYEQVQQELAALLPADGVADRKG